MQCLYSCKLFKKKILNVKGNFDENSMIKAVIDFFNIIELKKKKTSVIDPKKLVTSIKQNNQEFNNEDHHDSHEYLIWLLDILNENLKNEIKKNKSQNIDLFISDIFEGKQSSIIKCHNCENVFLFNVRLQNIPKHI
jgi:ubiquitin C-terminal hydrolase